MKAYIAKNIGRLKSRASEYLNKIADLESMIVNPNYSPKTDAPSLSSGNAVYMTLKQICNKYSLNEKTAWKRAVKDAGLKGEKRDGINYYPIDQNAEKIIGRKFKSRCAKVNDTSESSSSSQIRIKKKGGYVKVNDRMQGNLEGYLTVKEISDKFGMSDAMFYIKTKGHKIEKAMTWPRKYLITPEIEGLLTGKKSAEERVEKVANTKPKYSNTAYDIDSKPINFKDIDLQKGAYFTKTQIANYFGLSVCTVFNRIKSHEDLFKTMHTGDKMKRHYLINCENESLFRKYEKGMNIENKTTEADKNAVSFYKLCEELKRTEEEIYKKTEELRIEVHPPIGKNGVSTISTNDAKRLRQIYVK